jgi:membrane protein YdbS with pleckstrin-like domain
MDGAEGTRETSLRGPAEPPLSGHDAFTPADAPWTPVSPRLATSRRLTLLLAYIPLVAVGVALALIPVGRPWSVVYAVVAAVAFGWAWWIIGRRVRSFGYAEREGDLLVVSGILVRRLVIVPYGRMQIVDLRAGPIERWLGISTVQLHTAAATTDASIPGLAPDEAAALRDRLAERGEERAAGL